MTPETEIPKAEEEVKTDAPAEVTAPTAQAETPEEVSIPSAEEHSKKLSRFQSVASMFSKKSEKKDESLKTQLKTAKAEIKTLTKQVETVTAQNAEISQALEQATDFMDEQVNAKAHTVALKTVEKIGLSQEELPAQSVSTPEEVTPSALYKKAESATSPQEKARLIAEAIKAEKAA